MLYKQLDIFSCYEGLEIQLCPSQISCHLYWRYFDIKMWGNLRVHPSTFDIRAANTIQPLIGSPCNMTQRHSASRIDLPCPNACLAPGPEGSAHGLAIDISCTRVMKKKKKKSQCLLSTYDIISIDFDTMNRDSLEGPLTSSKCTLEWFKNNRGDHRFMASSLVYSIVWL